MLFLSRTSKDLHIGGIAEVIQQLSRHLPAYGVEVFIYTDGNLNIDNPNYAFDNMTPCYSSPLIKPGLSGLIFRHRVMQPLVDLVKKLQIDVVHTCGLYRAGFAAMHLQKRLGLPYVVTSHGDILPASSDRIKKKSVIRRCQAILQSANAVTHLTSELAAVSHDIYNTSAKNYLIPNGICLNEWDQEENERDYIFTIGRLVKEKGFDVLIDAYALLLKQGVSTSFVIAGEGPFEQALWERAKHHKINAVYLSHPTDALPERSICFTGKVQGFAKQALYQGSRIVLFATQPQLCEESFGLVPFEAMAAKKSLIMSAISRARQLQEQGFRLNIVNNPANPSSWAESIMRLLQNNAERTAHLEHNYALIKPFDWAFIAKQYQAVYQKAISTTCK